MLEILHPLGSEPMRDNLCCCRESIISEGVVAVKVCIDQIKDRLVGDLAHTRLNLARHVAVDMGVDDEHALLADHEPGVVGRRLVRNKSIDAGRQFVRFKHRACGMERRHGKTLGDGARRRFGAGGGELAGAKQYKRADG